MLEIEIDGKKLTVPQGSTVMEAAHSAGAYIPHFCYHKKLSIVANCRMCLVEVEKAPKPLPACATPVTDGMKVYTHSVMAKQAQQGVMEFLLINHPLDCPICDQGGECQLQDLAVGYGGSASRYREAKRSVVSKEMGPLVAAEEMSRCIHCTRCVRFTEEVGGFQEIGMAHRGEFSEILPFLGRTVDSEISGNVIDLCPVGALTSKPFRYSARTWELSRRKSISPHDGLGSNIIVQVKHNKVMRVLPLENEAINECWLADRDRFSYEGLNAESRLNTPMIKQAGVWHETDWQHALDYVVHALNGVAAEHGKDAIGFLASPHSTTEELYLFQKLAREYGIYSIDYRSRRSDFRHDKDKLGAEWLGSQIVELLSADSVLVIGSSLRTEHPLLAARLRQAVKKGTQLNIVHVASEQLLTQTHEHWVVSPLALVNALAQILKALLSLSGGSTSIELGAVHVEPKAQSIAQSLFQGNTVSIVLGNVAQHHPALSQIQSLSQEIARLTQARFGILSEAANSVGAELMGVLPTRGVFGARVESGLNAREMIETPRKAYLLLNTEVEFNSYNPRVATAAMKAAQTVIAMTSYRTDSLLDYADVLLPISPFSETAGSFINMEGRLQTFNGVVRPHGETRPAWKVLRVLGNQLALAGFDYTTVEDVRAEWQQKGEISAGLNNALAGVVADPRVQHGIVRVAEVPLYQADAICRHAPSLQKTVHAEDPVATANETLLATHNIQPGSEVVLSQGSGEVRVRITVDNQLPDGVIRLATAHVNTMALGGMLDPIEIRQG